MKKTYEDFDASKYRCPLCNGECKNHGSYERFLCVFRENENIFERVKVRRVKCVCCKHTHAILPDVIIPYMVYGLVFILDILKEHFKKTMSVEKLCEKYGISEKQFYWWLKLWKKDKKFFLGALKDKETEDEEFMEDVREEESLSLFFSEFFEKFYRSFMQVKLSIPDLSARKIRRFMVPTIY